MDHIKLIISSVKNEITNNALKPNNLHSIKFISSQRQTLLTEFQIFFKNSIF